MIPAEALRAAVAAYVSADRPIGLFEIEAILEAAAPHMHRTITTAEELDALPENTVIRDAEPATMQLMDGKWWSVGSRIAWDTDTIDFPITVLYEPQP